MKKTLVILLALVSLSTAHAGSLIEGATITRIAAIESNTAAFSVLTAGGTGPCVGVWVQFPVSAAPDGDSHKRAYATLLFAMSQGLRVTLWNYSSNACNGASYVEACQ